MIGGKIMINLDAKKWIWLKLIIFILYIVVCLFEKIWDGLCIFWDWIKEEWRG
jgi:hypothetical protein